MNIVPVMERMISMDCICCGDEARRYMLEAIDESATCPECLTLFEKRCEKWFVHCPLCGCKLVRRTT